MYCNNVIEPFRPKSLVQYFLLQELIIISVTAGANVTLRWNIHFYSLYSSGNWLQDPNSHHSSYARRVIGLRAGAGDILVNWQDWNK